MIKSKLFEDIANKVYTDFDSRDFRLDGEIIKQEFENKKKEHQERELMKKKVPDAWRKITGTEPGTALYVVSYGRYNTDNDTIQIAKLNCKLNKYIERGTNREFEEWCVYYCDGNNVFKVHPYFSRSYYVQRPQYDEGGYEYWNDLKDPNEIEKIFLDTMDHFYTEDTNSGVPLVRIAFEGSEDSFDYSYLGACSKNVKFFTEDQFDEVKKEFHNFMFKIFEDD